MEASDSFKKRKGEIKNSTIVTVDHTLLFVVELNASNVAIGATLTQNKHPAAFFSRTLTGHEHHPEMKKVLCHRRSHQEVETLSSWNSIYTPNGSKIHFIHVRHNISRQGFRKINVEKLIFQASVSAYSIVEKRT